MGRPVRPPEALEVAPAAQPDRARRARLLALASRALVAISLVFLAVTLVRGYSELPDISWDAGGLAGAALGMVLAFLAITISGAGWVLIVRGAVPRLRMLDGLIAVGRSGVAKYAPGNVLHYIGRAAGVRAFGVPTSIAVGATFGEAALVTIAALAIGLLGRARDLDRVLDGAPEVTGRLVVTAVALALVGLSATVVFAVSRRVRSVLRPVFDVLHPRSLALAFAAYLVSQLFLGLGLLALVNGLFTTPIEPRAGAVVSASALAWVVGFLTPGSPGGLGVREAVFVALAGPELGAELALAGIVALRVCTVLADLAAFLAATALGRGRSAPVVA